ncbi:MAG: ABC transporter permease [Bacilli bacterium]|jgi:oligopeptide transport system permease protein|nr:ABC transporter permease [Bacilli bacterium]
MKKYDKYDAVDLALEDNQAVLDINEDELFVPVTLDEKESEHIAKESYSYWKSVLRVFIRKPSAIIAITSLFLIIALSLIVPILTPAEYLRADGTFATNIPIRDLAPGEEGVDGVSHFWGTDSIGRDLFYITWTGARKSLVLAMISTTIIVIIGTLFGLIWGFFRKLDPFFVELYNLISNIPALLVYMLLATIFMQRFPTMPAEIRLIIALTMTSWIGLARFLRNQIIIINNREYNIASRALGTPGFRIMFKNLLPYILAVIITNATLTIPGMISSEVTMSFFGVGLDSATASIGALLELGRTNFMLKPWQLLAPAGVLAFIIFAFFLLGTSLSDALDPKKHR